MKMKGTAHYLKGWIVRDLDYGAPTKGTCNHVYTPPGNSPFSHEEVVETHFAFTL